MKPKPTEVHGAGTDVYEFGGPWGAFGEAADRVHRPRRVPRLRAAVATSALTRTARAPRPRM